MARHALTVSLAALLHQAASQTYPHDAGAHPDCTQWIDVTDPAIHTCQITLSQWHLQLETFRALNPSVRADCTPWLAHTSYCVATHMPTSDTVTTTFHARDHALPKRRENSVHRRSSDDGDNVDWEDKGCYAPSPSAPLSSSGEPAGILGFRFLPTSVFESLGGCAFKCQGSGYPFAGVQEGDKCFCGNEVIGVLAKDKGECNTPCAGLADENCGGDGRMRVMEVRGSGAGNSSSASATQRGAKATATESVLIASTSPGLNESSTASSAIAVSIGATTTLSSSATLKTGEAELTATPSSGAARNALLFGMLKF